MTELKVDAEKLRDIASVMRNAAEDIPEPPPAYVSSGADPISLAIAEKVPGIEGVIQTSLPQVKIDATNTASNMITAAGQYLDTDEQLAANYQKHQFDGAGGSGSGGGGGAAGGGGAGTAGVQSVSSSSGSASSAGSAGSSGQMGQLMSMPMQMASQAAQIPTQVMGAAASLPQGAMQAVQQISQLTGGAESSKSEPADGLVQDEPRDDEKESRDPGAAAGAVSERAPDSDAAAHSSESASPATPSAPVERPPVAPSRPDSSDPINL